MPTELPFRISIDAEIASSAERAALALGNLNGSGRMLPNPTLLFQPFMRREALASSRIEGTQAEFGQLVLFEANEEADASNPDIQEVRNYLAALETGWNKPNDRPISPGFIMELHQQLLSGVRGASLNPGALRSVQVHIGSGGNDLSRARFVPPPPDFVRDLVENLCNYIQNGNDLPFLVRLAVIHYQFETIHPFMDGNGRLGRLLMPIILGAWGRLDLPLLYLSEYFEDHREEYIDLLLAVSQRGDWKEWLLFVLEAIESQANDAFRRGQRLLQLREELRSHYLHATRSSVALHVIDRLFENPAITVKNAAAHANVSTQSATKSIELLVEDGVLEEVTGQKRNRVFLAPAIVEAMTARRSVRPE
ncbi:MAG TPA: Fic family protein [Thermomicrobiales bacterium]|nr:Fic family protein [Thermomicrobiales bacterium]